MSPHSTQEPGVSVIIPCYNHARFLPYAIQSIEAQTYIDWEAIIVDDGSTDNSREVAKRHLNSRICYRYQENRGLSAARNTGIRAARGRYLAFLDADDEWEPCFLSTGVDSLSARKSVSAVVTLTSFIDEFGTRMPRVGGQTIDSNDFRLRLLEGGFFPVHAVLVRTDAVWQAGLFDESLSSVEDWDLWLRITMAGGTMMSIAEPMARYRISTGSMSTNAIRMHTNRLAVLAKHFGPPDADPCSWPAEKRQSYAFAYRATALGFIAQQDADQGWRYFRQAVQIEPRLLDRLDTFYELALGDQPRGYRGDATLFDMESKAAELLGRIATLFALVSAPVQAWRGPAYGKAYLALAMLSDQAGDWASARRFLVRAYWHDARVISRSNLRRMSKLVVGKRIAGWLSGKDCPSRTEMNPYVKGE